MTRHVAHILPVFLSALFVGACSHSIPTSSSKPVPPPLTSAVPTFPAQTKEDSRSPVSQVPVQIKTDLSPIQTAIRKAIPEGITEVGHPLGQEFRWTFVRNGEPEVHIQDGLVAIHAEYKGDIESRGSARACRLDPLYATVDATGKLTMVQNGDALSFGFEPTQTAVSTKPDSDARCNMFNVPVSEQLPDLFGLTEIKTALTEAVHPKEFGIPLQRIWDDLGGPLSMPVASLNTRACMYGNPREMILGGQKGTTQETVISGTAKEMPFVTYETTCSEAAPTVALVNSGSVPAEGKPYTLVARIPLSYQHISHQVQSKLFHQSLFLNSASDTAIIERVSASDANGRALVAIDMSGDLKGTIYYWGTPRLEDSGRSISVPDLQMANESKAAIDSIRIGYWQLVDRELNSKLRQAMTVDISPQVDRLKQTVTGTHRSGGTTMDILITRQQPDHVRSSPQGITATIMLEGTANATGQVTLEEQSPRALLRQDIR
ncbi:MAG TPA: DUF4403 family protein [Nitrospira sp.]|nr:DUF4403 family protein [Nitrospira sp.]